jgi:hypothetical protein
MTDKKQDTTDNGISGKQKKVIAALLSERTITAAAKLSGVGERTIYTFMQADNFRAALRAAESELLNSAVRRLATGQVAALDSLSLLIAKAKHESTRRQASVDWLNLFLRFNDVKNIDERLTALEQAVANGK